MLNYTNNSHHTNAKHVDPTEFMDLLKRGLYDEVSSVLKSLKKTDAKDFLQKSFTSVYTDPLGEELKEVAPSIIYAAKHGHLKLVNLFIKQYDVNVNQDGCVAFDGYIIEGATALWSAAGAGYLSIVKSLVQAGASLNKTTKTFSTPLRAACFDGRLDIVKYLVDHGADVNLANMYKNTCLMIASYRGHLSVAEYLLQQKMDPNRQAQCGATALLFAAESGHDDIARLLIDKGAQLIINHAGIDPLYMAAEFGQTGVVNLLTQSQTDWNMPAAAPVSVAGVVTNSRKTLNVTRERAIHGLELLGAHLINDRDRRDMSLGFLMLVRAMRMREAEPALPKVTLPPVKAYNNRTESRSMADLNAIQYNMEALEMEALILRERILGADYLDLTGPIVYQGAVYADQGRFNRSLDLWLYALDLKKNRNTPVFRDLLRHSQLLSQMLTMEVHLEFDCVFRLLECTLDELDRECVRQPNPAKRVESEAWSISMHNLAYLMLIACQVSMIDQQEHTFKSLVYRVVKRDYRLSTGSSLLHMAADQETKVDYFHIMHVICFPSAALVKLLLQCGADPMAKDNHGCSPLHVISTMDTCLPELDSIHSIVGNLVNWGSHPDSVCHSGTSPYHGITQGSVVVRFHVGIRRLECLALEVALQSHHPGALDLLAASNEAIHRLVRDHRPSVRCVVSCSAEGDSIDNPGGLR